MRLCLAALLIALAPLAARAQQTAEVLVSSRSYRPHMVTLRAQTNLVEVAVVVRDSGGHANARLAQSDFELLVDGKPQPIASFALEAGVPTAAAAGATSAIAAVTAPRTRQPPRSVALFVDDNSMSAVNLAVTRSAARKMMAHGVAGNVRLGVFTASGVSSLDFTSDPARWLNALQQMAPRPRMPVTGVLPGVKFSPYFAYLVSVEHSTLGPDVRLAMARMQKAGLCVTLDSCYTIALAEADDTLSQADNSSADTLDALLRTIARLGAQAGSRTLLLASPGFLTADLKARQDEVASAALRAGVVIDSLDAKLLETEEPEESAAEQSLDMVQREGLNTPLARLAEATGGEFFENRNDMDVALGRMTNATEARYVLAFTPAAMPNDGKFHSLKVKLTAGRHGQVQARDGYFDPDRDQEAFPAAPMQALDEAALAAETPAEVPASVHAVWRHTPAGHSALAVTVRIQTARLHFDQQDHRSRQRLYFLTALFDGNNHFVTGKEGVMALALSGATRKNFAKTGLAATLSLPAAPGAYRLRTVVRVGSDGATTVLDRQVEVK